MSLINNFLNDNIVHAFGWTLIHSIWQILVIGLVLKLLLSLFKNLSTQSKYKLFASSLLLILTISIITFFNYHISENPSTYSENFSLVSASSKIPINQFDQSNLSSNTNEPLISIIGIFISSNINLALSTEFISSTVIINLFLISFIFDILG